MDRWPGRAPAAVCRKVAEANDGSSIEIWGDGLQTRSFLYIDECLEGSVRLMRSGFQGPVNIGSEEMVTISSAGDDDDGHCQQEAEPASHPGSARRARSQLAQFPDQEDARLGRRPNRCAPGSNGHIRGSKVR